MPVRRIRGVRMVRARARRRSGARRRSATSFLVLYRVLVAAIAGAAILTCLALADFVRSMKTANGSAEQEYICGVMAENGESYVGELADCQKQLAHLRTVERR